MSALRCKCGLYELEGPRTVMVGNGRWHIKEACGPQPVTDVETTLREEIARLRAGLEQIVQNGAHMDHGEAYFSPGSVDAWLLLNGSDRALRRKRGDLTDDEIEWARKGARRNKP